MKILNYSLVKTQIHRFLVTHHCDCHSGVSSLLRHKSLPFVHFHRSVDDAQFVIHHSKSSSWWFRLSLSPWVPLLPNCVFIFLTTLTLYALAICMVHTKWEFIWTIRMVDPIRIVLFFLIILQITILILLYI